MFVLLTVAFIVVPLAELAVIIRVGSAIGVARTVAVLLTVSLLGAWLVKREGVGVWRRIREQTAQGMAPGPELVDAFLILLAGALLLTPGFITDLVGMGLLLPPVRAAVRAAGRRRLMRRLERKSW